MIKISPEIDYSWKCPYCLEVLPKGKIFWQGIHVGVKSVCKNCDEEIITDLPVGHAQYDSYIFDKKNNRLFGPATLSRVFFGLPFLHSLQQPNPETVQMTIIKKKKISEAVIVNCLDYLYGHCLLKLFNVQRHLKESSLPVVVIVPEFLVWAVPEAVSETWVVSLSLSQMKKFYPSLDDQIQNESKRFDQLYVSKAYSHPNQLKIEEYTGIKPHDWMSDKFRISFIWREDRPWFFSFPITYIFRKIGILSVLLWWQNWQVIWFMKKIQASLPEAKLTVTGIGKSTRFPDWIEDKRFEKPNPDTEKKLCKIYSESRVVVGVHGSSMLLPSAHAGGVVNLLPDDRLGNFAQDTMYHSINHSADPRIISFLYRYLPINSKPAVVASQAVSMVKNYSNILKYFHTSI